MIEELNPECFLPENHESDFYGAFHMHVEPFTNGSDAFLRRFFQILKEHAVGWCDAQRILYKPMYGYVAVMCEKEDGYRFWFHIARKTFDLLFCSSLGKGDNA